MDESNRRARLLSAIGLRVEEGARMECVITKTTPRGEFVSAAGFVPTRREPRWKPPVRQRGAQPARLLSTRRRTHGTRSRAGVRVVRQSSARAGPSGDDPHSAEGDGDPPRDLFADVEHYLSRLGPQGAERAWLVDQVAYLGHAPEMVGAALALLTSEGKARRGVGQHGADVVWGRS